MALLLQGFFINLDTITFDFGQHFRNPHLKPVNPVKSFFSHHQRTHQTSQLQGEIGIFAGVKRGFFNFNLIKTDLTGTLAT